MTWSRRREQGGDGARETSAGNGQVSGGCVAGLSSELVCTSVDSLQRRSWACRLPGGCCPGVWRHPQVPVMACTLAANSADGEPVRGRGQGEHGPDSVGHARGCLLRAAPADAGGAPRTSQAGRQPVEGAVEESGIHAVQGGGEPFGRCRRVGDLMLDGNCARSSSRAPQTPRCYVRSASNRSTAFAL